MLDTRAEIHRLLGRLEFDSGRALLTLALCTLAACALTFLPAHTGLTEPGRWSLLILLLAALLWMTEAIPAFAVALMIIALEIALLGRPGGPFAQDADQWQMFVRPWSGPLIWLFLGGFVLADADGFS